MLQTFQRPDMEAWLGAQGIAMEGARGLLPRHKLPSPMRRQLALDASGRLVADGDAGGATIWGELDRENVELALDAVYNQPSLITSPNAAIPALLSTWVDPKLIEVILQPLEAEDLYGVVQKGDWVTDTAMFGMIEMTGEASAYGDFVTTGRSDINTNWPQRQSFGVQTFTEWGDRELARYALAKVDAAARKNISSANTLNRWMNASYFYGVGTSLQNYGALNDPSLSAALTPATKAAGGTSWQNALPTEVLADVQSGYSTLVTQTGSNIDRNARITLGIHSVTDTWIANTNSFGLTAAEMIKKAFPNLTIKTAPQYLSGSTYSYQLFLSDIDGQQTVECAFAEKMRAHRMVMDTSSQRQKKSCFSWGAIWYQPMGQVQMSGI